MSHAGGSESPVDAHPPSPSPQNVLHSAGTDCDALVADVAALQLLQRRVHFGQYVAEAKAQAAAAAAAAGGACSGGGGGTGSDGSDAPSSTPLGRAVASRDAAAVLAALTHPGQEAAVAARVGRLASALCDATSGGAAPPPPDAPPSGGAINGQVPARAPSARVPPPAPHARAHALRPGVVSSLWADVVMPLTKQVQVAYLLARGV